MVSFLIMASKILKNRAYLEAALRVSDRLYRAYPTYDYYGHTTSSQRARLLLLLMCVQLTGERDYSSVINEAIDYLASLQQPCGGIYSEDNITYELEANKENCENGITSPWDSDIISDQLYCVNNALAALSLVKLLPDDSKVDKKKGMALYEGLLSYVVKIQIKSSDKRFNGGWMRAFSITHGEYFGLDMDKFWGAYCIMAGWTMGIIPIALLSELNGKCPYFISD